MKRLLISIVVLGVVLPITVTLFGQTNLPPDPGAAPPANALEWTNLIITVLTPLVIAAIKLVVPRIPKVALPFIAPVVGVLLDQLAGAMTAYEANLVLGAVAGGLGVWLREITNQTKKVAVTKQLEPAGKPDPL